MSWMAFYEQRETVIGHIRPNIALLPAKLHTTNIRGTVGWPCRRFGVPNTRREPGVYVESPMLEPRVQEHDDVQGDWGERSAWHQFDLSGVSAP